MKTEELDQLLNHVFELAKKCDTLRKDSVDTGPFAVVPDGYQVPPLLDSTSFTKEEIDRLSQAILERAKKEDMSEAGMSFLKMFISILFTGIKIAGI